MITTTLSAMVAPVLGFVLLGGPPGAAVKAPPPAPRVVQAPGTTDKRAEVMQRIRTMRAWKLSEALGLDEATAAKLFPILNRYDEKIAEAAKENRRVRKEIRKALDGVVGDKEVTALVDRMVAQQKLLWDLQEARFKEVRTVLSAKQSARIFIVLPEIDRTIRRQVQRAMRGGADAQPDAAPPRRRQRQRTPDAPADPF